jgi:SAM-dependent methyltransferase
MHPTSYAAMKMFVTDHLGTSGTVLDVGALDINGTYRDLFGEGWDYVGLDLVAGPNVDVVDWEEIMPESFDAVISGQTLEHCADDGDLMIQMAIALKPGGYACIIVPSTGPKHSDPDYRRYTQDLLTKLIEDAGLEVVKMGQSIIPPWCDVCAIARKPEKKVEK